MYLKKKVIRFKLAVRKVLIVVENRESEIKMSFLPGFLAVRMKHSSRSWGFSPYRVGDQSPECFTLLLLLMEPSDGGTCSALSL